MPARSELARLLQAVTLVVMVFAAVCLLWLWPKSPVLAVAAALACLFGHSLVLAVEFVALRWVGSIDPAQLPTWGELVRAWWCESVDAVRVFCWRQAYRWRAVPDRLDGATRGRRGVVFIHGFVCNRGFWTPWLEELDKADHAFVAVNLEPVFASIDDYVTIVDDAVHRVTEATGMPPLLVCHSMGGLAARAWLHAHKSAPRVYHVVTIGSPHHGTWLGRFSRLPNGRQMRLQSDWLRELGRPVEGVTLAPFTCWYSNCDNIVFPVSTATLAGADNRLVRGAAHVTMAFEPEVMRATLALLRAPG